MTLLQNSLLSPLREGIREIVGPRSGVKAEIAGGAAGSFTLKAAGMLLRFGVGVVLARLLGADGYGIYAYAMALVGLMQVPVQLGLPNLLVREVAAYREKEEWGLLRGLVARVNQGVGALAVLAGLGALAATWGYAEIRGEPTWLTAFWVSLLLIPLASLSALRQATLRGLRHVIMGQTPEFLVRPGLAFLAFLTLYLWFGAQGVSPVSAVMVQVGVAAAAFLLGAWWLLRRIPEPVRSSVPEYETRVWARKALPFVALAGMGVINQRIDIVMLGLFRPDATVGIYQAVVVGGSLVSFGLQAVNTAVAPQISRLWATRDLVQMQRLATASARVSAAVALPVAVVFATLGGPLLGLAFGSEFSAGALALAILAAGQFINSFFGSVGGFLTMTQYAGLAMRGVGIAAGSNVIMNALLVPRFGMDGAAVATATSVALVNLILFFWVRRQVGISSSVLGRGGA